MSVTASASQCWSVSGSVSQPASQSVSQSVDCSEERSAHDNNIPTVCGKTFPMGFHFEGSFRYRLVRYYLVFHLCPTCHPPCLVSKLSTISFLHVSHLNSGGLPLVFGLFSTEFFFSYFQLSVTGAVSQLPSTCPLVVIFQVLVSHLCTSSFPFVLQLYSTCLPLVSPQLSSCALLIISCFSPFCLPVVSDLFWT